MSRINEAHWLTEGQLDLVYKKTNFICFMRDFAGREMKPFFIYIYTVLTFSSPPWMGELNWLSVAYVSLHIQWKRASCDLLICSSHSGRRCFALIGNTEGFYLFTKENEMLASTGELFVTTSTAAALCYCGCVTDEDWSFVNSQIGFQVLSLITLWFYWWETTDCFSFDLPRRAQSSFWICCRSPSSPKALQGQIKRGEMLQPLQISHASSCSKRSAETM